MADAGQGYADSSGAEPSGYYDEHGNWVELEQGYEPGYNADGTLDQTGTTPLHYAAGTGDIAGLAEQLKPGL